MQIHIYLLTAGLLLSASAQAQVYKCTFADSETRQNKVIYTDVPCGKSGKQSLTDIQAKSPYAEQNVQSAQSSQELDAAVTRAVLNRDFKLAKSLAATKEHWRLIVIAEGESAPQTLAANSPPVAQTVDECAQARESFESVSRTSWRDRELVAAQQSVMNAACGIQESQNPTIIAGYPFGRFGGIYGTRWGQPHYLAPHGGIGHRNYGANPRGSSPRGIVPRALGPRGFGHYPVSGGFSSNFRSKSFGVNGQFDVR